MDMNGTRANEAIHARMRQGTCINSRHSDNSLSSWHCDSSFSYARPRRRLPCLWVRGIQIEFVAFWELFEFVTLRLSSWHSDARMRHGMCIHEDPHTQMWMRHTNLRWDIPKKIWLIYPFSTNETLQWDMTICRQKWDVTKSSACMHRLLTHW